VRILVVDVAAEAGGALTILNQYYDSFSMQKENEYIFCISVVDGLKPMDNVSIVKLPWVKKSWFHRLWFDYFYCLKVIKKYNIDQIFSLQNVLVPMTKLPQILYLHQPLPFSNYKFSIFENKKFWIYQNIIGRMIKKSVKKAKKVIVQTEWMKQAIIHQCGIDEAKIEKIAPTTSISVKHFFDMTKWQRLFFYPASNLSYKNHIVIFEAIKLLKQQGSSNFKVAFTLTQEALPKDCAALYIELKENIELLGNITHEQVMELYSRSILLFPSYIETFGLPLLEARSCKSPVIASDMPFSREILEGYDNANYFSAFSADELKNRILKYI
jgi:glycosyltransferase involved in cell wall biosynthesis